MAELLRTHLLGERAAGVRADGSLGLRANRDPELDEPGAALVCAAFRVVGEGRSQGVATCSTVSPGE